MHLPHPVLPRTLRLPEGRAAEFYYERLLAMSHLPDVGHVDCGEGAHGVADPSLAGPGLPTGLAADEAQLLRRKIALAVVAGRAAGLDAGGWSRWAEQFLQPTVDWRRTFGAAVRGACSAVVSGRTDYRYHRPSRRQIPQVVLPSLVRPVPSIAVVLDTSGSVTDRELSQAWGEVLGMLRGIGVRREQIRVWATDVSAHRVQWKPGEKVELIGGGGTDMSNGIDAALRDRPTPDVVVVLTDGETPWPSERPLRPVIVGLFSAEGQARPYARTPTWATVVEIPTDA
jgi:predicted metal-dependent peptidase